MEILIGYLIVINVVSFFLMLVDKRRAVNHKWRIPERVLFFVSFIGGSLGAWAGMYAFRHKTKHVQFVLGIPAILVLQIIAAVVIVTRM